MVCCRVLTRLHEQNARQLSPNLLVLAKRCHLWYPISPWITLLPIMGTPPAHDQLTLTSTSLLLRVRGNDSMAWERFVRLYTPLIYSWSRQFGLQPGDAEDVCQDALASVLRTMPRYERIGSFRAWLWQIVRRRVQDLYRKRGRQPQAGGGTDFHERIVSIPDSPADDSGIVLTLRTLSLVECQFEPTTWRAFWLMVVEQQSALEVARQLGWCEEGEQRGAARVRQAKARVVRCVREEFGELLDL